MKKIFFLKLMMICSFIVACKNKDSSTTNAPVASPYTLFFDSLHIEELSDTILIQAQPLVFGCGTAAIQHDEYLRTSGLYRFYEQYNDVLSDSTLIVKFSQRHQTKILWVSRGNEGELLELSDSNLHADSQLEARIFKEKCFIKIAETPHTLDSISIAVSVAYPIRETALFMQYQIVKRGNFWNIVKVERNIKKTPNDLEHAYFP